MKIDGGIEFGVTGIAHQARDSERLGYDGVWSAETGHDPFLPLAVAADATERLELATGIAVAFARNPMNLAVLANDLQGLSRGRFLLGLGSQIKAHITRRFSMPWSHPAPRMKEMILAIRAIWASWAGDGSLDFRGEFYTHTLMSPFFNPGPNQWGNPPILVAAVGELMAEVAGEAGDGLLVHPFTTARYLAEVSLPALLRGAAQAGKTRSDLTVSLPGFVVTGDTEQAMAEAVTAAKAQIAFYGSTPAYRGVLELHGWGDLQPELNTLTKRGEWAAMGDLITDEMLEAFCVVCEPDQVAARVTERFGGLVDRFSFYRALPIPEDRLGDIIAAIKVAG